MENKDIVNTKDNLDDLTKGSQNNLSKDIDYDNNTENSNLTSTGTGTQDLESLNAADVSCLEKQIARAYKKEKVVQAIMMAKVDGL